MPRVTGQLTHENWDEKPLRELGELKIALATIDVGLSGGVVGTARAVSVLSYPDAVRSDYAGYLLVDAAIDGRKGQFMIAETGVWLDGVARSAWRVVEGSGRDGLAGISGTGGYEAEHGKAVSFWLDYAL